jgi:hypothetical protein
VPRKANRKKWIEIKMGLPAEMRVCQYCGCELVKNSHVENKTLPNVATVDHRYPKSKSRFEDPINYILSCLRCNQEKGAMTEIVYREFLKNK